MKIEVTDDLEACLAVRMAVFVAEQGYSEAEELDGQDDHAIQILARDGDRPVGTARVFAEGATGKIGRVCVLPEMRGTGLGADLVRAALEVLRAQPGIRRVKLSAQVRAMGFYEKLGFVGQGADYDDGGVPHRDMVLDL
ncbi:GNAT family N-acetyltransferase [Paracoccus zhejiangensis]|uniref:Drug:proton antiporter n=1 Tax=Paracoccus zhejiangensis TaxID=1077935 RepID=A0A2H5F225_9RHOB|nr:GNAT family N-acetyltransferase [Paracoccus zhejiangensis]AUH65600.1 drug:proton antiporter [Paracoccus zhejiangensis]